MDQIPFTEEKLRESVRKYEAHANQLQARTLDVESFWEEEKQMLTKFPKTFQNAGCVPEPEYLKCLTKWKWAGLWKNHAHKNTREEIRTVTGEAFQLTADHPTPSGEAVQKQLDRLGELTGVGAATGTVLLTFWRPNEYSVMDQRALGSLAVNDCWTGDSDARISEYPRYLDICRAIARETGLSLRNTDRALWMLGE